VLVNIRTRSRNGYGCFVFFGDLVLSLSHGHYRLTGVGGGQKIKWAKAVKNGALPKIDVL
jgi:hypothetical protein